MLAVLGLHLRDVLVKREKVNITAFVVSLLLKLQKTLFLGNSSQFSL